MRKPPNTQKPTRKPRKRTQAQQETFGSSFNANREGAPELGREIAKYRRDHSEVELSHLRVARGY